MGTPRPHTSATVKVWRSRATTTHTCSLMSPRFMAGSPRLRAGLVGLAARAEQPFGKTGFPHLPGEGNTVV